MPLGEDLLQLLTTGIGPSRPLSASRATAAIEEISDLTLTSLNPRF